MPNEFISSNWAGGGYETADGKCIESCRTQWITTESVDNVSITAWCSFHRNLQAQETFHGISRTFLSPQVPKWRNNIQRHVVLLKDSCPVAFTSVTIRYLEEPVLTHMYGIIHDSVVPQEFISYSRIDLWKMTSPCPSHCPSTPE